MGAPAKCLCVVLGLLLGYVPVVAYAEDALTGRLVAGGSDGVWLLAGLGLFVLLGFLRKRRPTSTLVGWHVKVVQTVALDAQQRLLVLSFGGELHLIAAGVGGFALLGKTAEKRTPSGASSEGLPLNTEESHGRG